VVKIEVKTLSLNPKDPRLDQPLSSFSLSDAVGMAKAMVHPDLAPFITTATIKQTYEHSVRAAYPIRICKNYFEQAAKADKRKQSMNTWDAYFLGARDILTAKTNFDPARVNGQRALLYRLDIGQLQEATVWGSGPGDEGNKATLPFWHVIAAKIEENEFRRQSGETDIGYTMSYLDRSEPLSPETIINQITKLAVPISALDYDAHRYKPVIVIGKLGGFKPLEEWEETGQLVPVLDADRNPVIDPKTGSAQMRPERQPSAEGQPFIQQRIDDPNKNIYTFQANIAPIDEDDKSENRLRFRFLNKKLGNHFVDLPLIQQIFSDAVTMGVGTSEDAVEHLTGTYAGTEVLVAGVITRFYRDEERSLNWIDMEATLCVPLDAASVGTVEQVVTTSAPVTPAVPAPPAVEMVTPSGIAPAVETPPPAGVDPVVLEAATAPTPQPAAIPKTPAPQATTVVDQLKTIVHEGRELYGPTMTITELQSLRVLPEHMVGADGTVLPDHVNMINHVINMVAKEAGDSPVGAAGTSVAAQPVVESAPAGTAAPQMEPMICPKCQKVLQPDDVLGHAKECPGVPPK